MQLTVLVDNNTLIDRYYLGEPGVAYYLEDGVMSEFYLMWVIRIYFLETPRRWGLI